MSEMNVLDIDAMLQRWVADPVGPSSGESPTWAFLAGSASLAAHADVIEERPPERPAAAERAAFLDGALSAGEAGPMMRLLASSPGERLEAEAVLVLLEGQVEQPECAPQDVVEAACRAFERQRGVTVLRPHALARTPPAPESFLPLAAASRDEKRPLFCRSQSGIWTLEVFVDEARQEPQGRRAHLLLTVHAEHRASYEGLTARVYVGSGAHARVLTEQVVHNGEVFAEFELGDLDLWTRDAISVVFEPTGPQG